MPLIRINLLLIILISSCSLKTNYIKITEDLPSKSLSHRIDVYYQAPEDKKYIEICQLTTGDTGFTTECSKLQSLQVLMVEARKHGGDAIVIIQEMPPSVLSTCWRHECVVIAYIK